MAATHHSIDMYPIHRVPATRPFIWLAEGWDSLLHHKAASLAYGAIVAALGALILAYDRHPLFIATAIAAFMVVGPVITAGLCELSRARDHGDSCDFQHSLQAMGRRRSELLGFAEMVLFIAVASFSLAALFLYSTDGAIAPRIEATLWGDVVAQLSALQITTYAFTLGGLGVVIFALSVVSVPMIIDRHVDAGTAMQMSLRVAIRDLPAMVIWVLLIVSLVAFAFGTKLWGMIIVMPLLGHATWYAYRDIVEEE
jgi:uncharacterized membrane protein